ncbi:MAG TPA: glycosyl hydrolase family 18 protein [Telluria sp.]|nr:glycosyl hydrolase family 18 protein [Telluria sp.]
MLKTLLLALSLTALPAFAAAPKALFYLTRDAKSVDSFLANADRIDVLSPHWIDVDPKGAITGEPDPRVMEVARKHGIAVTPLVTNKGFIREDVHELLTHPERHPAMFAALVRAAKQHGYAGFQLDLEHVPAADRDALTALVRAAADALHKEKLHVSIAVVPAAPLPGAETGYQAWHAANWGGAFDLKAIGEAVDLLCLMTYDQHGFTTLPGPVAGYRWVEGQLEHALKLVPKEKLALGIPVYGYHWAAATPNKGGPREFDSANLKAKWVDAVEVAALGKKYKGHFAWDAEDRTSYMYFYRDNVREWIYYSDTRTFDERYKLVKQHGLAGFASWVLGSEDPGIWKLLPKRK